MQKRIVAIGTLMVLTAGVTVVLLLPRPQSGKTPFADPQPVQASVRTATPVVTAAVKEDLFVDSIQALGTVLANESVTLTSTVEDRVLRIEFEDGQAVEKGDLLVVLDSREVAQQLVEARAALKEQRWQFDRIRRLANTNSTSQSRFDEEESMLKIAEARVAQLEARLQDYTIRAPFAGILGIRRISAGAVIDTETEITTLDDIATVKLDFTIPEMYLSTLKKGLPIIARSQAYPDRRFEGNVSVIGTRVDSQTRSVTVRALLSNPNLVLKPGMLLTVELIKDRSMTLMVPEEAVIMEQDRTFVLVVGNESTVEKREIETRRRRPGKVEVLSGLVAGEQIVVQGLNRTQPGAAVVVVESPLGG